MLIQMLHTLLPTPQGLIQVIHLGSDAAFWCLHAGESHLCLRDVQLCFLSCHFSLWRLSPLFFILSDLSDFILWFYIKIPACFCHHKTPLTIM